MLSCAIMNVGRYPHQRIEELNHGRSGRSRSIAPQFVMGVLIIVVGARSNLGFIEAARTYGSGRWPSSRSGS